MISYISKPKAVAMADEWFQFATTDHFWVKWRFEALLKFQNLLPQAGARILEIGCGNGMFLKQLKSLGLDYELHGCDLNIGALNRAESDIATLYVYDIFEQVEALKDKFDAIFLMDVIEHIDADSKFLSSAMFHLRPGGRIYINVPAHQWLFSKYDTVAGHQRRYSRKSLGELIAKCNLVTKQIYGWGFLLIPIAVLRKAVLIFVTEKKVIDKGFNPSHKLIEQLLQILRKIELKFSSNVQSGTSFLVIAEK